MPGNFTESNEAARQLRKVLLGYLQAASVTAWPGGDGLTLENILDFYPEAVAAGEAPDWQELLCRHPELATELQAWLAAKKIVGNSPSGDVASKVGPILRTPRQTDKKEIHKLPFLGWAVCLGG
jgi:hypothetical protein